jgi:hypothetical protein
MIYKLQHIIHLVESDSLEFGRVYTKEGDQDFNYKIINQNCSRKLSEGLTQIAQNAPGTYWVLLRNKSNSKDPAFHQQVDLTENVTGAANYSSSDIERIVTQRIEEMQKAEDLEDLKSENEALKTGAGKLAYMVEILIEKFSTKFTGASPVLQGVPGKNESKPTMSDNEKGQYILQTLLSLYTLNEAVSIVTYLRENETARILVEKYALDEKKIPAGAV